MPVSRPTSPRSTAAAHGTAVPAVGSLAARVYLVAVEDRLTTAHGADADRKGQGRSVLLDEVGVLAARHHGRREHRDRATRRSTVLPGRTGRRAGRRHDPPLGRRAAASACAGLTVCRWTITSNHCSSDPPSMYESGPACASPRVLAGRFQPVPHRPWRARPQVQRELLPCSMSPNGFSNHSGFGFGCSAVCPAPRYTAPWSKVNPIDRYPSPYQRRRCEPALAKRMSGSGAGRAMRRSGALAVCGLAAQYAISSPPLWSRHHRRFAAACASRCLVRLVHFPARRTRGTTGSAARGAPPMRMPGRRRRAGGSRAGREPARASAPRACPRRGGRGTPRRTSSCPMCRDGWHRDAR